MFKIFFFLWRRPDLNSGEFKNYYETKHAPLGISLSPPMADYRRNYPEWNERAREALGGFDVMTEIWHEERSVFDQQISGMQVSPSKEILGADEARFIDRNHQLFVTVDERGLCTDEISERSRLRAGADASMCKIVRYIRAAAGTDLRGFVEHYETAVVPRIQEAVPGLLDFRRNYAQFDDPYSFSGGHHNMLKSDRGAYPFDLIEEIWMTGGARYAHQLMDKIPTADGASVYPVQVDEHRSPGGRLLAPTRGS